MPIDLTRPAPPVLAQFYPGMSKGDQIVWERFLVSNENQLDGVLYNVKIGTAFPTPQDIAPNLVRFWEEVNKTRVDALGIQEQQLTVFEVKVSAGLSAIGQAIGGRILAEQESDDPRPIVATIVTDAIRPDARLVADALRIRVLIFPP